MAMRPAPVTDSELASSHPARAELLPPSAATGSHLREAARFVISPDGHADDARLQAEFKRLRAEAPVFWVDTPGMRPFWLLSRHGDISAVERRGAPFTPVPRTFLTSRVTEERLERMLGKPYVIRGLLQMDDPEHATYRAVAQPSLTPAALASMEPWLEEWADHIVSRIASRTGSFDFTKEIAVPFSISWHHAPALGLPEADDDLILKLSWGLVGPEDSGAPPGRPSGHGDLPGRARFPGLISIRSLPTALGLPAA